jgi:pyruvate kinase
MNSVAQRSGPAGRTRRPRGRTPPPALDRAANRALVARIDVIRRRCLALEARCRDTLRQVTSILRPSARNLLHYVGLRQVELRGLQHQLALRGLSSLGHCESSVLAALEAVRRLLARLGGLPVPRSGGRRTPVDLEGGPRLLRDHAARLFGPAPRGRWVRIMVTMPGAAAGDGTLVREWMAAGMNVARINCAHDGPEVWRRLAANIRRAEQETGDSCRIMMDLAGPKLRTGAVELGPPIVSFQPERDERRWPVAPAQVLVHRPGVILPGRDSVDAALPVEGALVDRARVGDEFRFLDSRRRRRLLRVTAAEGEGVWRTECPDSTWVEADTPVELLRDGVVVAASRIGDLPAQPRPILLRPGDVLVVTTEAETGHNARPATRRRPAVPAQIPCTLDAVFRDARVGHRILFDDGKIEGVIRSVNPDRLEVAITRAAPQGSKLRPEKGINLPDTDLSVPALGDEDLANLRFAVEHADLVSLSFVHRPEDVLLIRKHLAALGRPGMGLVLKIETRSALRHLPRILLAGMQQAPLGVMVARGDLAVEAGWERLPEIQEDLLWICEAAHVPVIWATQVLEGLAKKGLPSRAEVTDAAMSARAECVMLNKGPHIVSAVRFLDGVLSRMQAHQYKKRDLMRRLDVDLRPSLPRRPEPPAVAARRRPRQPARERNAGP